MQSAGVHTITHDTRRTVITNRYHFDGSPRAETPDFDGSDAARHARSKLRRAASHRALRIIADHRRRCVILYFVLVVTYCTVHRRSVVIRASPESVLRAVPDLLLELISCRKSWRLGGEPD